MLLVALTSLIFTRVELLLDKFFKIGGLGAKSRDNLFVDIEGRASWLFNNLNWRPSGKFSFIISGLLALPGFSFGLAAIVLLGLRETLISIRLEAIHGWHIEARLLNVPWLISRRRLSIFNKSFVS